MHPAQVYAFVLPRASVALRCRPTCTCPLAWPWNFPPPRGTHSPGLSPCSHTPPHPGGTTPHTSHLCLHRLPGQPPPSDAAAAPLLSLLPPMRQLPLPLLIRCGSCSSPSSLRCSSVQLFRHPHPHAMPPTSCHVASGLPADAPCLDVLLRTCPFLILLRFTLNVNGAFLP